MCKWLKLALSYGDLLQLDQTRRWKYKHIITQKESAIKQKFNDVFPDFLDKYTTDTHNYKNKHISIHWTLQKVK